MSGAGERIALRLAAERSAGLPVSSEEAKMIESAVEKVLDDGLRTADIMQPGKTLVGTRIMGDAIIAALDAMTS